MLAGSGGTEAVLCRIIIVILLVSNSAQYGQVQAINHLWDYI